MNMRPFMQALRSEAGEKMVLEENFFIEKILPGAVLRTLTAEEMAEYRRPFAGPGEGRRPTLTWPREIPIEGEPADVNAIVAAYAEWLATSDVPKLFMKAKPGALLGSGANLDTIRAWPAQTEVTVAGVHFVQEDSPDEIGRAIADWMGRWLGEINHNKGKGHIVPVQTAILSKRHEVQCWAFVMSSQAIYLASTLESTRAGFDHRERCGPQQS
jgi:hypothetical protein